MLIPIGNKWNISVPIQ